MRIAYRLLAMGNASKPKDSFANEDAKKPVDTGFFARVLAPRFVYQAV
jgi:hypothetical protein